MKVRFLIASLIVACTSATHLFAIPAHPRSPASLVRPAAGQEQLTGRAAAAHLQELQARETGLAAAAAGLRKRGFEKTGEVTVIRSTNTAVQPAQHSYNSTSGEMVFWSWDDGDSNTWEGVIYVEDHATGATSTWNAQLDVTEAQYEVIWEQHVGSSGPRDDIHMTSVPRLESPAVPQVASLSGAGGVVLVQSRSRLREWIACVIAECPDEVRYCRWVGAWCYAAVCQGAAIECGVRQLM